MKGNKTAFAQAQKAAGGEVGSSGPGDPRAKSRFSWASSRRVSKHSSSAQPKRRPVAGRGQARLKRKPREKGRRRQGRIDIGNRIKIRIDKRIRSIFGIEMARWPRTVFLRSTYQFDPRSFKVPPAGRRFPAAVGVAP
ncbi:hypothetical protein EVAR_12300_1 [Eumeta japonica]|uniref:Uncharacterized protein n=1 Tax=Eumeta variegata TaxID=151549 RepID=A0A4C1TU93_EUMVA|nr:hypothetical protein EVAR_12300_1 [Eumeta japonica]